MPFSFLYREAQINFKAILMKWHMEAEKYRHHKIMNSLKSLTFLTFLRFLYLCQRL
jgi:hypothetical protein